MHLTSLFGAGAVIAAIGWSASTLTAPTPAAPPLAAGHYVLVVEGDRSGLTITHVQAKIDPWAGVATGFASDWQLTIRDDAGAVLAEVPLDVSQFATDAAAVGKPVQVKGCIVRDARIGMLVNAPRFAAAATYTFTRREGKSILELGVDTGGAVRDLAGEER